MPSSSAGVSASVSVPLLDEVLTPLVGPLVFSQEGEPFPARVGYPSDLASNTEEEDSEFFLTAQASSKSSNRVGR